jgi:pilus assembly protein Flp/PilA
MLTALVSFLRRDDGQGLAEYALVLALIAVVSIAALAFLGTSVSTVLSTISNKL